MDYFYNKNFKKICEHTKKECLVNDTVNGSTCPLCKQYGLNGVPVKSIVSVAVEGRTE